MTTRVFAVIPALNEEPAIAAVVRRLLSELPPLEGVVVVDNGSTDRTAAQAAAAGAKVVAEPRRGYGRACLAGVNAATQADILLLLDGDGADDVAAARRVLQPVLDGTADLCVGTRAAADREAGAMTVQQVLGNRLAALILRRRYRLAMTDPGPMRAIRRDVLLRMQMSEMTYGWTIEMTAKAARLRLRYVEVPVAYRRRAGKSKVGGTLRGSLGAAVAILGTLWRHRNWAPEPHPRSELQA
ncbi:MAG TPA: glycosyltransferase family 2 protein [Candidatus Dormibacteraeota bacterium]|nr:glycosyltransferase family 2 protein [Candidatus Dormibacteraeota bacterium]